MTSDDETEHVDVPREAMRSAEPTEQDELDKLDPEYREVD